VCRGDLLYTQSVLFMDCEKVTEAKTHLNLAGDLSIVDLKGRLLFFCHIRRNSVCRFNKSLTGLDQSKMDIGLEIEVVN
jgi:hypothetical protein